MPVSIVIGGQFGSEGKGKVALEIARRSTEPVTVIRVGGPNSGHTGYDRAGNKWALRQLPASSIDKNVDVVFPAGSYLDIDILLNEIEQLNFPTDRIFISPFAQVILPQHKVWEREGNLISAIGSTGSGVGGAVMANVAREASNFPLQSSHAENHEPLQQFIADTETMLSKKLQQRLRIVVEGTQGFGLSLLEGGHWPKATSRSTTAAAALSEAGLSPLDVDDVTLVIRSYPIRVAGDSGPLHGETTWAAIARNCGKNDIQEYTTVTQRIRRVGHFDAALVKRAIAVNRPSRLVMNHLDYIASEKDFSSENKVSTFVNQVATSIGRNIDWFGFSPHDIKENVDVFVPRS